MDFKKPETKLMNALFCALWSSPYYMFADDDLHDSIDGVSLKDALAAAVDTLSQVPNSPAQRSRAKRIIVMRFGFDDGQCKLLREIGKEFNVSVERIRQMEARALRQLRHPSRSRNLKRYIKETAPTRAI